MGSSTTIYSIDYKKGHFFGEQKKNCDAKFYFVKKRSYPVHFPQMYLCLLQNGEDVIRDALVIMSKTGDIYVGVLGTEPSLFSAPRPEARQVNYEETDIEMASLNTIIKTAQTADEGKHTCPRVIILMYLYLYILDGGAVTSNANVREELTLKVDFSPHIETCFYNTMVTDDDNLPMTRISVSLSSSSPLTKVRVGIDVMEPLVVTKTSFIVNSLSKLPTYLFSYFSKTFCPKKELI